MDQITILVLKTIKSFGKETCLNCSKKKICSKWIAGIQKQPETIFLDKTIEVIYLCSICEDYIMQNDDIGDIPLFIHLGIEFAEEYRTRLTDGLPILFHRLSEKEAIDLDKQVNSILTQKELSS